MYKSGNEVILKTGLKVFKDNLIFSLLFTSLVIAQDFSPGPYGTNYYDTAGPFQILDFNAQVVGDIDYDESIDVEDALWSNMAATNAARIYDSPNIGRKCSCHNITCTDHISF